MTSRGHRGEFAVRAKTAAAPWAVVRATPWSKAARAAFVPITFIDPDAPDFQHRERQALKAHMLQPRADFTHRPAFDEHLQYAVAEGDEGQDAWNVLMHEPWSEAQKEEKREELEQLSAEVNAERKHPLQHPPDIAFIQEWPEDKLRYERAATGGTGLAPTELAGAHISGTSLWNQLASTFGQADKFRPLPAEDASKVDSPAMRAAHAILAQVAPSYAAKHVAEDVEDANRLLALLEALEELRKQHAPVLSDAKAQAIAKPLDEAIAVARTQLVQIEDEVAKADAELLAAWDKPDQPLRSTSDMLVLALIERARERVAQIARRRKAAGLAVPAKAAAHAGRCLTPRTKTACRSCGGGGDSDWPMVRRSATRCRECGRGGGGAERSSAHRRNYD